MHSTGGTLECPGSHGILCGTRLRHGQSRSPSFLPLPVHSGPPAPAHLSYLPGLLCGHGHQPLHGLASTSSSGELQMMHSVQQLCKQFTHLDDVVVAFQTDAGSAETPPLGPGRMGPGLPFTPCFRGSWEVQLDPQHLLSRQVTLGSVAWLCPPLVLLLGCFFEIAHGFPGLQVPGTAA